MPSEGNSGYSIAHKVCKNLNSLHPETKRGIRSIWEFSGLLHHIVKYLIGYYSQLRPHKHNGGMSQNKAEENYWVNYKSVASFT